VSLRLYLEKRVFTFCTRHPRSSSEIWQALRLLVIVRSLVSSTPTQVAFGEAFSLAQNRGHPFSTHAHSSLSPNQKSSTQWRPRSNLHLRPHSPDLPMFRSASKGSAANFDPNNPNHQPEQQHTNIKAAIKLYEDGKIDGMEQVFIIDGRVVPKKGDL